MTNNKRNTLSSLKEKINSSNLSDERRVELLKFLEGQSEEFLEFLNSDNFIYSELHIQSEKSLLEGIGSTKDFHVNAYKLGMNAIAITDRNFTHGWSEMRDFHKNVTDRDRNVLAEPIIPIYGVSLNVNFNPNGSDIRQIVLLASNKTGYENVLHCVSEAHINPSDTTTDVDINVSIDFVKEYSEGVIALTGVADKGFIRLPKNDEELERQKREIIALSKIFPNRLFLEANNFTQDEDILDDLEIDFMDMVNAHRRLVIELSKELNIPMIATNDCFYPTPEMQKAQDYLITIKEKDFLSNPDRVQKHSNQHYLKDKWEMLYLFMDSPEAVFNTQMVVSQIEEIEYQQTYLLPEYPNLPEGVTESEYLVEKVFRGLKEVYSNPFYLEPLIEKFGSEEEVWKIATERANFEISVLQNMGFEGYMLIVSWINELAREDDILIGPGRGSAAGSLIALALKITTVCPLRYDLLFERFLNPNRIEMPDVDCDYQDDRRRELIAKIQGILGKNNVAQICTFGLMKARNAIRSIGTITGKSAAPTVAKILKALPPNSNLKEAFENHEFKEIYDNDAEARKIIDAAIEIEGMPKNHSTHAAGLILSREDLRKHTSFQKGATDVSVIQVEMKRVDSLRMVKQDALGIKNLTLMKKTFELVEQNHGVRMRLEDIPLDDKETLKMLSRGESVACFQLESTGMRELLRNIHIDKFEDLVDCVALYRPGVLSVGMHLEYVKNKFNPDSIFYIDEILKPILAPTRGILIYQEQAMKIVHDVAGFSLAKADILRKAIGAKDAEIMSELKEEFITNSKTTSGIEANVAEEIWHLIEVMAKYSFNKSHTVCYAEVAMKNAYMKCHYPLEYMTSAIEVQEDNRSAYIAEIKRMGFEILPPNVNLALPNFSIKENSMVFGLSAVLNVGASAKLIVEEREENGPFKNLRDFRKRVGLSKGIITSLISSGAFDSFGFNRNTLLENIEEIMSVKPPTKSKKVNAGQLSLIPDFDSLYESEFEFEHIAPEPTSQEICDMEVAYCKNYITSHPLESYLHEYERPNIKRVADLVEVEPSTNVSLLGVTARVHEIITKKGDKMAFVTLDDTTEEVTVVVFPSQFAEIEKISEHNVYYVQGKLEHKVSQNSTEDDGEEDDDYENNNAHRDIEIQIIAQKIIPVEEYLRRTPSNQIPPNFYKRVDFEEFAKHFDSPRIEVF